jgi:hypothetical protein
MFNPKDIPLSLSATHRIVSYTVLLFMLGLLYAVTVQFAPSLLSLMTVPDDAIAELRDADRWVGIAMLGLALVVVIVAQPYQSSRRVVVLGIVALLLLSAGVVFHLFDAPSASLAPTFATGAKIIALPLLILLMRPMA